MKATAVLLALTAHAAGQLSAFGAQDVYVDHGHSHDHGSGHSHDHEDGSDLNEPIMELALPEMPAPATFQPAIRAGLGQFSFSGFAQNMGIPGMHAQQTVASPTQQAMTEETVASQGGELQDQTTANVPVMPAMSNLRNLAGFGSSQPLRQTAPALFAGAGRIPPHMMAGVTPGSQTYAFGAALPGAGPRGMAISHGNRLSRRNLNGHTFIGKFHSVYPFGGRGAVQQHAAHSFGRGAVRLSHPSLATSMPATMPASTQIPRSAQFMNQGIAGSLMVDGLGDDDHGHSHDHGSTHGHHHN